jgi:hypothetical protein
MNRTIIKNACMRVLSISKHWKKLILTESSISTSWSNYMRIIIEIMTNVLVEAAMVARVQRHTNTHTDLRRWGIIWSRLYRGESKQMPRVKRPFLWTPPFAQRLCVYNISCGHPEITWTQIYFHPSPASVHKHEFIAVIFFNSLRV